MMKPLVLLVLVFGCALAQYDRFPPPPPPPSGGGGFGRPPPPPPDGGPGGFGRPPPPPPDGGLGGFGRPPPPPPDGGFGGFGRQPPPPPDDGYSGSSYNRYPGQSYGGGWSQSYRVRDRGYPDRYPRSVGGRGGMHPPPPFGKVPPFDPEGAYIIPSDEKVPEFNRRLKRSPSSLPSKHRRSPKMQYDGFPPPPPPRDDRFFPPPPPPPPGDGWSQSRGRPYSCRIMFINQGAYTLQVKQEGAFDWSNDLLIGQTGTFDVDPNVPIRLKAVLGRHRHCYPTAYCGGAITCRGTTLIGFDCDC